MKDSRLHYLLEKDLVKFEEVKGDDYFKILVLHQNRFKGIKMGASQHNSIRPEMIKTPMNLIIWGHEHESENDVNSQGGINVYQPGSTIPTSFIEAEAINKHFGYYSRRIFLMSTKSANNRRK